MRPTTAVTAMKRIAAEGSLRQFYAEFAGVIDGGHKSERFMLFEGFWINTP
jgi:hypothetical protein